MVRHINYKHMKKIFLFLIFSVIVSLSYSQNNADSSTVVKKVELQVGDFKFTQELNASPKYTYCTVSSIPKPFENKVSLLVDFGQPKKMIFFGWQNQLKDANGRVMFFNSEMDGINYLANFGWEIQQVIIDHIKDNNNQIESNTYYLMRKKVE